MQRIRTELIEAAKAARRTSIRVSLLTAAGDVELETEATVSFVPATLHCPSIDFKGKLRRAVTHYRVTFENGQSVTFPFDEELPPGYGACITPLNLRLDP